MGVIYAVGANITSTKMAATVWAVMSFEAEQLMGASYPDWRVPELVIFAGRGMIWWRSYWNYPTPKIADHPRRVKYLPGGPLPGVCTPTHDVLN